MEPTFTDDPGVKWMLAFQAGSEAAFDRLVETYSGQVYALFTRFLGQVPEREDLVQEVFLRVLRSRERYTPTARFSTYLYRVSFNLAVNHTERDKNARSLDEGALDGEDAPGRTPAAEDGDPLRKLETDDVVLAVREAIASLPDTQRMALILAKYDELSFAEIAVVLGSSEKAIKSLVHRARESLRERLKPFLEKELA
ncbi:MAG TPA: RNA polymerase sigma factor [Planctomycetota bacterium]|nr:RNA polymerase sigma factor [Planctomycetota bacterium]